MRGLHARLSDVHAFSGILKRCSTFCALRVMMRAALCVSMWRVRDRIWVDVDSTKTRRTGLILRSATDLTRYDQFGKIRDRFCVIRFSRVNEQAKLWRNGEKPGTSVPWRRVFQNYSRCCTDDVRIELLNVFRQTKETTKCFLMLTLSGTPTGVLGLSAIECLDLFGGFNPMNQIIFRL